MSSRVRIRRLGATVAMTLLFTTAVLGPAAPAAAADPPRLPREDAFGIDTTRWDPADTSPVTDWRYVDASMKTGAIYRGRSQYEVRVRVLLPPNYEADRSRHAPYPVLYLLHGGSGNYDDWAVDGDVKGLVRGSAFNGIVVMPEGGATGYYTDWYGPSDGGFWPAWETFHIQQLLPWVDANFNTTGDRSGRAIAGLSMGAWGALKYAGQHPDKFSAAASFSGGGNIRDPAVQTLMSGHMWMGGACISWPGLIGNCWDGATRVNLYEFGVLVLDQNRQREYRINRLYGPQSGWGNVNPWDMALRYRAYAGKLALYSGGDPNGETGIFGFSNDMHQRFDDPAIAVAHRWCTGNGEHNFTYWKRDLTDFINYVYGTPIPCHYDVAG